MIFSLIGFVLLYTIFMVVEMFLMFRAIRKGPESDHSDTAGIDGPAHPAFGGKFATRELTMRKEH